MSRSEWLAIALLVLETALSAVLLTHALLQLSLARAFRRAVARPPAPTQSGGALPRITLQLPIFNERTVIERLLDHVATLDYPRELLEVQVLDDSTDETSDLVAIALRRLQVSGLACQHLRRSTRAGFKAGALRQGLARASGEFIAVLDADFVPRPQFLRALVGAFDDPHVGAVQSRWGHANRDASLLTRVQALLLDTHFSIEQVGRSELGCFVNFNGSAGIWRASAIRDAGDWSALTLTEDLDLSYRAQLRGWRIVYVDRILASADLPTGIAALRIQQRRWMLGVAQNLVRLTPRILRAPLPLYVKVHGVAHLAESALYGVTLGVPILGAIVSLLDPPLWVQVLASVPPAFLTGAGVLFVVYRVPRLRRASAETLQNYAGLWLAFFAFSLGLSAHNGAAVVRGLSGRTASFERTPKVGSGNVAGYGARVPPRSLAVEALTLGLVLLILAAGAARGVLGWQWLAAALAAALALVLIASVRADALHDRVADAKLPSVRSTADATSTDVRGGP